VVALGTCFTTFSLISNYCCISILPWFSEKSTVTLAILSCLRVVGLPAVIVDVLPENAGDKGLLILPMVFVYLATLLILNVFASVFKVKEKQTDTKETPQPGNEKAAESMGKINEVAVFTIYTDEISHTKL
jgi:predicted Na+-dependent transporter